LDCFFFGYVSGLFALASQNDTFQAVLGAPAPWPLPVVEGPNGSPLGKK
jgi:hypothetical protein